MKKWIKYIAVVCCFFMMVVLFFPYAGSNMVRASEGGTVSGGNVAVASEEGEGETGTVPWTVTIKFNVDGDETETIEPVISGDTFGFTTASAPTKDGYEFTGWLCSVSGESSEYELNNKLLGAGEWTDYLNCTDYTGATITLTAQWKLIEKSVTVRYVADGGSFEDSSTEKTETITSTDGATDFTINITGAVPEQDGYNFAGWKCEKDGTIYQDVGPTFSWTDYVGGEEIVFTAQWTWNGQEMTKSGTYTLNAGQPYTLGDGTWTVNDDNSSYSGGIQFYVPSDGSYTFNSN